MSKQVDELAEPGHRLSQSLGLECCEQLCGCLRRLAKALALPFDCRADCAGGRIEQRNQEVVGVLSLDVEAGQRFGGKVREVVGHDDAGAGPDCGGQDMPVVGIRQDSIRSS